MDPEIRRAIIRTMKSAFQDLPFYEKIIEPKLSKMISEASKTAMNHSTHKGLTEKYYTVSEFNKNDELKTILSELHVAVRACYVLVLAHQPDKMQYLWSDVSQLLVAYPEFQGQDEQELRYLLQFRNMMRLALIIVNPRMNKKLLIKICARLEGSGKEYITGGGQKPCVNRRVLIYEREGNVQAEKREERPRNKDPENLSGKKRPQLNTSFKRLKLIRIASEDARNLVRNPDGTMSRQNSYAQNNAYPSSSAYGSAQNGAYSGTSFQSGMMRGSSLGSTASDNSVRLFDEIMGITPANIPTYKPAPPNFGAPVRPIRTDSDGSMNSAGTHSTMYSAMHPAHPYPQYVAYPPPPMQEMPPSSYLVPGYQGSSGSFNIHSVPPASFAPPPIMYNQGVHFPPSENSNFITNQPLAASIENMLNFPSGILSRQASEWLTTFIESHIANNDMIGKEEEEEEAFPTGELNEANLTAINTEANANLQKSSRELSESSNNLPSRFSGLKSREISLGFNEFDLEEFLRATGNEDAGILIPMMRAISWDATNAGFQEELFNILSDEK